MVSSLDKDPDCGVFALLKAHKGLAWAAACPSCCPATMAVSSSTCEVSFRTNTSNGSLEVAVGAR